MLRRIFRSRSSSSGKEKRRAYNMFTAMIVVDCAPNVRDRSRKIARVFLDPAVQIPMMIVEPVDIWR